MPSYRRWRVAGGTYFLTLATHQRRPILCTPRAREILGLTMEQEQSRRPFTLDAIALLPDHIHLMIRLPTGDEDYSTRIGQIKRSFTLTWLAGGGKDGVGSASRRRQRYRGVWQKRFWEHTIRDRRDWSLHLDYIHANPVKHGLVCSPGDWAWSSFHRYVRAGWYEADWCGHVELPGTQYLEPG